MLVLILFLPAPCMVFAPASTSAMFFHVPCANAGAFTQSIRSGFVDTVRPNTCLTLEGIFHRMKDSALTTPHMLPLRQCFVSYARNYRDLEVLCTDCRCSSTSSAQYKLLYLVAGCGSCSIHNVPSFSNLSGDHVPHNSS